MSTTYLLCGFELDSIQTCTYTIVFLKYEEFLFGQEVQSTVVANGIIGVVFQTRRCVFCHFPNV